MPAAEPWTRLHGKGRALEWMNECPLNSTTDVDTDLSLAWLRQAPGPGGSSSAAVPVMRLTTTTTMMMMMMLCARWCVWWRLIICLRWPCAATPSRRRCNCRHSNTLSWMHAPPPLDKLHLRPVQPYNMQQCIGQISPGRGGWLRVTWRQIRWARLVIVSLQSTTAPPPYHRPVSDLTETGRVM